MGIFSPIKRNANKFRYQPRYYDPEKERRDQRRRELCGTSSQDDGEYTPGQYLRTQREARRLARANSNSTRRRPTTLLLLLGGLAAMAIILYPRIVALMEPKRGATAEQMIEKQVHKAQSAENIADYEVADSIARERAAWPHRYRNIIMVPNDSKEAE